MIDKVLTQAQDWGFMTRLDDQGIWQIIPQSNKEEWRLQQIPDRWLLIVNNVPQVSLTSDEVIDFLKRLYLASLK